MDSTTFGKLIRAYREQRGWKQQELAERWGFTREYVSQIERGKRKLDKQEQVTRLADILGIPEERLGAVGKRIPHRKTNVQHSLEGEDILLQSLLEPAQTTVKMSWLIWQGDSTVADIGENLRDWEQRLDASLEMYRGQFYKPALRLLAYIHEMRGKLAMERTATKEAMSHFQEMYDIAEELSNSDLLTLALIHQSEMFRRYGRYEASFRRIEAAEKNVQQHVEEVSSYIQGVLWKAYARNYYVYGDEQGFLRTIDRAAAIAEDAATTIDTLSSEFDKVEVLQVRAQGYAALWKPEKALEIYKETDRLRPFRPLRYQSSYYIEKAQAYCYAGDTKNGIEHAMTGLKMAENLHSIRYVMRLQQMSNRLSTTSIGKEHAIKELRGEILGTLQRMNY